MLLRTIVQRVRPSGEHANHLRGSINSCVREKGSEREVTIEDDDASKHQKYLSRSILPGE